MRRVVDLANYVAQEDIRRFRRELEDGADGARQDMVLRLLVEEENKVGLTYEKLDEVLRQIGRIKRIISTQLDTIAMLKGCWSHQDRRCSFGLENAQAGVDRAKLHVHKDRQH